jgi:hypothetical protein
MRLSFLSPLSLPIFLAGLSPCLWGCPGTLADPAEFEDAAVSPLGSEAGTEAAVDGGAPACVPANVPTAIFQQTCGVVGCHSQPSPQEGLDLASPGVAARLLNAPSMEMPSLDLINAMEPESSAVLTKLSAPPPYGSQMPFGEPPLSSAEVACVAAWIQSVIADGGPAPAVSADAGSVPAVIDGG